MNNIAKAEQGADGTRRVLTTGLVPLYVPYLFLLPGLLLLLVFRYYPALSAIYHSFTIWDLPKSSQWIGLDNYRELFNDDVFLQSLWNIIMYTIGRTLLTVVMAFVGAELVYNLRSATWRQIWRLAFTVPMVIPNTVDLLIWKQIYAGRQGLLNRMLIEVGLLDKPIAWLGRPDTSLNALIFIGFPLVTGFAFLIILAALQNLPQEVNDAALLDGCSRLRRVFAIDIPGAQGALALIVILNLNAGMQQFAPMLVVTQGGPINASMSPGLYLYNQAFLYGKFGYATAIGTVLMFSTLILSVLILQARYRKAHDVTV